jgi:class 3 adenylate cyclase
MTVRIELVRSQDGFHVPYVAKGNGPPDVVHVLGLATHRQSHRLELPPHGYYERLASFASVVEEPRFLSYCERLASFSRLIVVDERGGTGAALDSTSSVLTLEERMDDISAVLDVLGVDQVTLMGDEDTASVVRLYAATFPSRIHSLVSMGPRESLSDLRSAPPAVDAPTLAILQSAEGTMVPTFIEIPGECVPWKGDIEALVTAIQEVTGRDASQHHGRELATILLTDIVDSTRIASEVGTRRWTQLLDQHDALVRHHLERFGGRAIKSTGDGVLATFDGPARAMRCACALRDAARSLGLRIRAGLHTGEIEARGSDIAGIAVHIAARVESLAQPGEVWVSSTIPPLVAGSGITFLDRGEHTLKGVPGSWTLSAAEA